MAGNRIRTQTLTSSDHCDGRLDVDPLICVDSRVDEDQAVKVRLLTTSQRVLDGVVILEKISPEHREGSFNGKRGRKTACKAMTYKHVISPFVSGRITVEVFRKAWLNMGAFILQMTNGYCEHNTQLS